MSKKIVQLAVFLLTAAFFLPLCAHATEAPENPMLRVGLFYGDQALPAANLENNVSSGYRFGYFDSALTFYQVGYTAETQITVLKAQNMYWSNGAYGDVAVSGAQVVGCFHIQLNSLHDSFESAQAAALQISGFPAWSNGRYVVRVGAYESSDGASAALTGLGLDATVVGTSSNGVTVVRTKTAEVLFQFDGDAAISLAIQPGLDGAEKAVTWFKKYRYYGAFQYQRVGGGNLTVVNFVPLEDYVKGVLPYEMSNSWPLEALKAQAVCARTYALMSQNKHRKNGFDVCNTTDCQVYRGANSANAITDQAVDETYHKHVWYNGGLAETFFFSCDGGATESVRNVWNPTAPDIPYLKGVIDPYEGTIADKIERYNWSVTFTKGELVARLNAKGYACSGLTDFYVAELTPTGNVLTITFVTTDGKKYSFSNENCRIWFGTADVRSTRYTIAGGGGSYFVNDAGTALPSLSASYAVDGQGNVVPIVGAPYVATGMGIEPIGTTNTGDSFTLNGTGWGHNVGMSQWGANAMAQQGKTFEEILKFYFTGVEVR